MGQSLCKDFLKIFHFIFVTMTYQLLNDIDDSSLTRNFLTDNWSFLHFFLFFLFIYFSTSVPASLFLFLLSF